MRRRLCILQGGNARSARPFPLARAPRLELPQAGNIYLLRCMPLTLPLCIPFRSPPPPTLIRIAACCCHARNPRLAACCFNDVCVPSASPSTARSSSICCHSHVPFCLFAFLPFTFCRRHHFLEGAFVHRQTAPPTAPAAATYKKYSKSLLAPIRLKGSLSKPAGWLDRALS
jgi:hypothetical protein